MITVVDAPFMLVFTRHFHRFYCVKILRIDPFCVSQMNDTCELLK